MYIKIYVYICISNNDNAMKKLIIEIENLHNGQLHVSRQVVLGVNTKEEEQAHVAQLVSQMSNMHLKSDYKLSRIYFEA